MEIKDKVSTGIKGFDKVIDNLRLGDNVVWQVDAISDYKKMVDPYVEQALSDGRNLIYFRFGSHKPLMQDHPNIKVYRVSPKSGFETFATTVHNIITKEGKRAFYVFDCLSDLLKHWHSDLIIGNFFKVTCPYLYELDTVAYFAIFRNVHTFSTIAGIRETTQLLLDLYQVKGNWYIHPLRVWQRYSPTMFFPHLIQGQEAISITASAEAAELFSSIHRGEDRPDHWIIIFNKAKDALKLDDEQQDKTKTLLLSMLMGSETRMLHLCEKYFTLKDVLAIASREIGSGHIGGKSVGMLVARKILEVEGKERYMPFLESHDSFYIGTDVFYTYVVQNGWWRLRTMQKTLEGYYTNAPELKEKLLHGSFPENIQEQFVRMLEYFGQSPLIVRSSSLLEDNFGNAFAGKYESVFCANQGTPGERYSAFSQAVRTVYASTMNPDALAYRMNRGLFDKDEQMAILVQRVSGDYHQDDFFPHAAGVGNSSNLYVWDKSVDMEAGMLRLVFGLGTRAVDRTVGDYARIVTLDDPLRIPIMNYEDQKKFSQHYVDVISLRENILTSRYFEDILSKDIKADKGLFVSIDQESARRMREKGQNNRKPPILLDFHKLLMDSHFPALMKDILAELSSIYEYPVDIEFTVNFGKDNSFKVNLLQCRPLQTRGLGRAIEMPVMENPEDCLFSTKGNFMGGNMRLPIDYVVYVQAQAYLSRSEQEKYEVARQIGRINNTLKGQTVMLIGPGRWGTTTPGLGVPVHFSEISNMSVVCEVASTHTGMMPELSYGSHFFQDLVETGIFYAAIFDGQKNVVFHPERVLEAENLLGRILTDSTVFSDVIKVVKADGMIIYSDILTQSLICR